MIEKIDALLKKTCFVIDILPRRVPSDRAEQYLKVEEYFLNDGMRSRFLDKIINVILKLMCYVPVSVFLHENQKQLEHPGPETVAGIIRNATDTADLLFGEDTLFVLEKDDLYLSVYHPDDDMQELIRDLVRAEGLFWRKAE